MVLGSFATPAQADSSGFSLKVNFQTQSTSTPSGYKADFGQSFSTSRGYGWERMNGEAVTLVGNGREWNVHPDKRLDTYMHLDFSGSPTVGTRLEGRWSAVVPNGSYKVVASVGDASYTDSHHVLRAEGNKFADFTPTNSNTHSTHTANVNVTDGKLTIDQTGGDNTKINYVEITGTDSQPPASGGTAVKKVNFGLSGTTAPQGYVKDSGQAYSSSRGYGWLTPAGQPLDLVINGRERNAVSDKRLDSFVHMDFNGPTGGKAAVGKWELDVPNGTYSVTVGVGDPSYTDSKHLVRAEGQPVVDLTPTNTTKNKSATATVTVTDGKLTLDQTGGTNTKINYVDVTRTSSGGGQPGDTAAPEVGITLGGNTDASGKYVGSVTATIDATDNVGIKTVSYTLNGSAPQPYSSPVGIATPGDHVLTAMASDAAGNISKTARVEFTIVAGDNIDSILEVSAPQDFLGIGNRMVFSTVAAKTNPEQSVSLKNAGSQSLNVTGLAISGPNAASFVLGSGQASSFEIPAGQTRSVRVKFTPSPGEVHQAQLTITTDNAGAPPALVTLGGMNAVEFEDVNEPSLQAIVDASGYAIDIDVTYESTNFISKSKEAVGDEVLVSYFNRADSAKPVELHPLANYSGRSTYAKGPFGFNNKNSSAAANAGYYFPGGSDIFGGQNQKMMPSISGGSVNWNNPTETFGFRDGNSGSIIFSDDKLNNPNQFHNVRIYPAKTTSGGVVPNTYVVGVDLNNIDCCYKNWDYQDYVFLMKNVVPEGSQPAVATQSTATASTTQTSTAQMSAPTTTTPSTTVGSAVANIDFATDNGGVADAYGKGTGFKSLQAGSSYDKNDLAVDSARKQLMLRASKGTNSGPGSTQVNALQLPVDGRNNVAVQSSWNGSFRNLNVAGESQSMFIGTDGDNFARVSMEYVQGQGLMFVVYVEDNGVGRVVRRAPMPNPGASKVDLIIKTNKSTSSIDVSYRLNGSSENIVQRGIKVPTSWLNASTQVGVATSQGEGNPFTALLGGFRVSKI
jgi:hypothetical protein